jgi:tyrosine-protein phosphatase SIW14
MMKYKSVRYLSFAVALFLTSVVVAQTSFKSKELPNFHQVNEYLYRGAQPQDGGIKKLAQLGIKTIINLRDDDERARAEEAEAHALGLSYFNVPLPDFNRPDDKTIKQILALIAVPENQPVFLHCKRGADRTGTVVAIYRIEHDGWDSERAKAEAKQYGLGFWQIEMKDYIHDYYQRWLEQKKKAASAK